MKFARAFTSTANPTSPVEVFFTTIRSACVALNAMVLPLQRTKTNLALLSLSSRPGPFSADAQKQGTWKEEACSLIALACVEESPGCLQRRRLATAGSNGRAAYEVGGVQTWFQT